MTDPIEITGNDDEIRAALLDINLPTLLVVMTHFIGDDRFLTERYQPKPIEIPEGELFPDDSGGYTDEIAAEIREAAFNMIVQMRDEGYSLPPAPDLERMKRWMEFSTAMPIEDSYSRMLLEEVTFNKTNVTSLDWSSWDSRVARRSSRASLSAKKACLSWVASIRSAWAARRNAMRSLN